MPSYTGTEIARHMLREIGVLDPVEAGHAETIADALVVTNDLIDSWRADALTIGAVTRSVYSLSTNTQTYTIGSGGTFNQDYPHAILSWSVIPDDDAADPNEIPMGLPLTTRQWQGIGIKSQTGSYPTRMWFNDAWAAGLGSCLFHPIPDNADVDVVLYSRIPELTSIVAATTYQFRPGAFMALKLNGALELVSGRYAREGGVPEGLERRAARALGRWKAKNVRHNEGGMRAEFASIGHRGRSGFNIRQGDR